jgi:hypothetical protein
LKAAHRRKLSRVLKERWARIKVEQPEKWAEMVQRGRDLAKRARERKELLAMRVDLDGKQMRDAISDAKVSAGKKEPEEPGSPVQAFVVEIPVNPRLVFARSDACSRFEVLVGDNRRLWVEAPMLVAPSVDFPGYYEFVGELPKGRWDRSYAERFLPAVLS